jgi:TP901 family phage tail tape measure protein
MNEKRLLEILIKLDEVEKNKTLSGIDTVQSRLGRLSSTKIKTITTEGLAPVNEITQVFKPLNEHVAKGKGLMSDFGNAMRRALIVAPVWMVMRGAIQGVTQGISEGFKTWMEFDNALAKNKAVIHDYAGTTNEAMKELEERIRTYSKESGQSLQDLAAAFYRFGTVGIAFENALSGAIASAKLAKVTFGDIDTISRSMAMTYRLLGDSIDSTLSPMQKQESLAGKIYHLWKTNAFEANEFASSLNNFVSTANIANFTADQTVATLAALGTAGVQGSRGGTLLKTSIQKLVENLDELAPALGLGVNPELEKTFDLFMRVLSRVNELSKTKGIPKEAIDSINKIFGGVRGGQVISALNALLPELKQNLIDVAKDPMKFIGILDKGLKDVSDTASDQMKIFNNLKLQFGEAFVKGALGAEDFKEAMKKANVIVEAMIPVMERLGIALVHPWDLFTAANDRELKVLADFSDKVKKSKEGLLSFADTIKLISELENKHSELYKVGVASGAIPASIKQMLMAYAEEKRIKESNLSIDKKQEELYKKYAEEKKNKQKEEEGQISSLTDKLQDKLRVSKEELSNQILLGSGVGKLVLEHKKLDSTVSEIVSKYNGLIQAGNKHVKSISAQSLKALVLKGDFEGIIELMRERPKIEKELTELSTIYTDIQKESVSLVGQLVAHELDLARIRGADERTILNTEVQLGALSKDTLEYKLRMEKLLTTEKKNQWKVTSDEVALYKIGTQYNTYAADEIGKVLANKKQIKDLDASTLEIFKKMMPEKFKEYEEGRKVKEFLGLTNVHGEVVTPENRQYWAPGGQITLPQEEILGQVRNWQELIKTFAPSKNVEIGEILVNITNQMMGKGPASEEEYAKMIADAVSKSVTLRKKIKEAMGLGKAD